MTNLNIYDVMNIIDNKTHELVEVLDGTLVRYLFEEFAERGSGCNSFNGNGASQSKEPNCPKTSLANELLIQIPLDQRLRLDLGVIHGSPAHHSSISMYILYPPGPLWFGGFWTSGSQLHQPSAVKDLDVFDVFPPHPGCQSENDGV